MTFPRIGRIALGMLVIVGRATGLAVAFGQTSSKTCTIQCCDLACIQNDLASPRTPQGRVPSLPDTSCSNTVGVGAPSSWNPAHVYWLAVDYHTIGIDTCPDHDSGEYALGISGAWLFSRTGAGIDPDGKANQGSGVAACFDPTSTAHHGPDTTVNLFDDAWGGAVGFTVTSDWNRTEGNFGSGNDDDANHHACGDALVEPCAPPNVTEPACNHLDQAIIVTPAASSSVNSWTVAGGTTLADFAGADGSVVAFTRIPGTTGQVWTT